MNILVCLCSLSSPYAVCVVLVINLSKRVSWQILETGIHVLEDGLKQLTDKLQTNLATYLES